MSNIINICRNKIKYFNKLITLFIDTMNNLILSIVV